MKTVPQNLSKTAHRVVPQASWLRVAVLSQDKIPQSQTRDPFSRLSQLQAIVIALKNATASHRIAGVTRRWSHVMSRHVTQTSCLRIRNASSGTCPRLSFVVLSFPDTKSSPVLSKRLWRAAMERICVRPNSELNLTRTPVLSTARKTKHEVGATVLQIGATGSAAVSRPSQCGRGVARRTAFNSHRLFSGLSSTGTRSNRTTASRHRFLVYVCAAPINLLIHGSFYRT